MSRKPVPVPSLSRPLPYEPPVPNHVGTSDHSPVLTTVQSFLSLCSRNTTRPDGPFLFHKRQWSLRRPGSHPSPRPDPWGRSVSVPTLALPVPTPYSPSSKPPCLYLDPDVGPPSQGEMGVRVGVQLRRCVVGWGFVELLGRVRSRTSDVTGPSRPVRDSPDASVRTLRPEDGGPRVTGRRGLWGSGTVRDQSSSTTPRSGPNLG